MDRKGKVAVLVTILAVVVLGLYRNFGVPVLRFWPLILIDTILRIPGDIILRLINPRVSTIAFEILRGLTQFPMALLLGRGVGKFWNFLRSRPQEKYQTASLEGSPLVRAGGTGKKWLTLGVSVALGLLVFIPRVGRQLVELTSFLSSVYGHPLYVSTEVFMEGAGHELNVSYFGRPESRKILLPGEARTPADLEFQANLISRFKKSAPLLRPGRIEMRHAPIGISQEEAESLERQALDFINAFLDLYWTYTAEAALVFSQDRTRATYKIETYSYDGPLAAIGFVYAVEFVKVDRGWLVVRFGHAGSWLS